MAEQHDTALARAVEHFNAERYRDALLLFEERWHAERSDLLRALIQVSNAHNQLRLGLVSGPRRNLASAAALLAALPPHHCGIDVVTLRTSVAALRALLPDDHTPLAWADVPRMRL